MLAMARHHVEIKPSLSALKVQRAYHYENGCNHNMAILVPVLSDIYGHYICLFGFNRAEVQWSIDMILAEEVAYKA